MKMGRKEAMHKQLLNNPNNDTFQTWHLETCLYKRTRLMTWMLCLKWRLYGKTCGHKEVRWYFLCRWRWLLHFFVFKPSRSSWKVSERLNKTMNHLLLLSLSHFLYLSALTEEVFLFRGSALLMTEPRILRSSSSCCLSWCCPLSIRSSFTLEIKVKWTKSSWMSNGMSVCVRY